MKAQSLKSTYNKTLAGNLQSDIDSRRDSGVPLVLSQDLKKYYGTDKLSYEFISNHLGEGKAIEWEQGKEQADRDFSAIAHMNEMPASDIQSRVDSVKPVPGSPDYPKQKKTWEHAQKEADKILKDREIDPARAADQLDGPKAALSNYQKTPTTENAQNLVAARMEAQKYLEVDEAIVTPLTNQEASHLAKPFNNKGLLDPAGAANAALTKLREMVGGDDDALKRGVATILKQKGINENAAVMMSVALSKQNKAPASPVTPSNAPTAKPASVWPTYPTIDPSTGETVPGPMYDPSTGLRIGGPPDDYADRDTGLFDPKTAALIPHDRVKALFANPAAEADNFDKDFGPGASATYIQRQNELSRDKEVSLPPVTRPFVQPETGPDSGDPTATTTSDDDPYKPKDDEETGGQ